MIEIDKIYRKVPSVEKLECTALGDFRYNGKPKRVIFSYTVTGRRGTARITIMIQGKSYFFQASKLVAETWKADYIDGSYITYKDGNCHNITADNLEITNSKGYYLYMRRNTIRKADSLNERKRKLQLVADQALMTKRYFDTLDMSDINNHVKTYLYECLMNYALNTLHMGEKRALETVPEVIGDMYEKIMNGMCLYNYERFCKKILLDIKKKGKYGEYWHKLVKPIKIEVEQLNLDCLWERFKVTRLK